ncbi:MAG: hypothetical protein WCC90_02865 [Methylocella sp.]
MRGIKEALAALPGAKEALAQASRETKQFSPSGPPQDGIHKTASKRLTYESGQRTQISLKNCFPCGIPCNAEMPNGELVRCVQAKHGELFKDTPEPDRKTILIYAGRKSRI